MSAPALEKKPGGANLIEPASVDGNAMTPGKRTLTEQLPGAATYVVKPGETLTALAAKLHTTVEALKAANPGKLKAYPSKHGVIECFNAGEMITVPGAATPGAEIAGPKPAGPSGAGPSGAGPSGAGPSDAGTSPHAAPAEPGWMERISGAFHNVIDAIAGKRAPSNDRDGKPADPRADEHDDTTGKTPADKATGKTPADATGKPADAADKSAQPEDGDAEAAPFAELSEADRGAKLSSFTDKEIGTVNKDGFSFTARAAARKRGQWINARDVWKAGRHKSGDDYVNATDELIAGTKLTEDQSKVVDAARAFAAAPRPLTPAQQARGTVDWSTATLELDGKKLHPDLKARLEKYVHFLAWANLMTGPVEVGSVMRSPAMAHKLSVGWMFNLAQNTATSSSLHDAANRQKLVANVTARGGSDQDGNPWLSDATVEELKANKGDDDKLFETIKTKAAPEAQKLQRQGAIAAEGYEDDLHRHPNVAPGSFVSNHLKGEAVDMKIHFVMANRFDSLIDAIAMHFGLYRAVKEVDSSPEHWHYERVGAPPGTEMPG